MGLNIVCTDLRHKTVVMSDLGTLERAEDYLKIFEETNSFPKRKTFDIVNQWGNSLTTEELKKLRREKKHGIDN